jgi:hypothetical protein
MKKMFTLLMLSLTLSLSAQGSAPSTPSKEKVSTEVVKPVEVVKPTPIVDNKALVPSAPVVDSSTKKPVDTVKAEVKQATAPVTTPKSESSGTPWGFIAIIAIVVAIVLLVSFKGDDAEDNVPVAVAAPDEPEQAPATEEVTKDEPTSSK